MKKQKKILIANRGEIVKRISRTAKAQGYKTVSVYSEEDLLSPHVKSCDESIYIGETQSNLSYSNIDKIIEAAKKSSADFIHPGYGFLSESSELSEACKKNSIIFIGPESNVLKKLGDKSLARKLAKELGIPIIEGYEDQPNNNKELLKIAKSIGFPLVIKASSGGGGRGIRLIKNEKEFLANLEICINEANRYFSDSKIVLEKYVQNAKHIEVQIVADSHGNIFHLFERDCSLQRRYQKIIEETPTSLTSIKKELLERIYDSAIKICKKINLIGVATVEFLVDTKTNSFFFLEVNPRIQVEHPITEQITKCDIVALQLKIAGGEKIDLSKIRTQGHSIELRICAEIPELGFIPSSGRISKLTLPSNQNIRWEHCLSENQNITLSYDSLLAKLIVTETNKEECTKVAIDALSQTKILGINTNINFLKKIISDKSFKTGQYFTNSIDSKKFTNKEKKQNQDQIKKELGKIIALKIFQNPGMAFRPFTKYGTSSLLNLPGRQFQINSELLQTQILAQVRIISIEKSKVNLTIDNKKYSLSPEDCLDTFYKTNSNLISFLFNGISYQAEEILYAEKGNSKIDNSKSISSPIPGKILRLHCKQGQKIKKGQTLFIIESMKIEHEVLAAKDLKVDKILKEENDVVSQNEIIITSD